MKAERKIRYGEEEPKDAMKKLTSKEYRATLTQEKALKQIKSLRMKKSGDIKKMQKSRPQFDSLLESFEEYTKTLDALFTGKMTADEATAKAKLIANKLDPPTVASGDLEVREEIAAIQETYKSLGEQLRELAGSLSTMA